MLAMDRMRRRGKELALQAFSAETLRANTLVLRLF
jgi:hypothetical protein